MSEPIPAGAVFVGLLPMESGQIMLPGGWLTGGAGIQVSSSPVALRSGEVPRFRDRLTIPGGVCAIAASHGFRGDVGVFVGVGRASPELVTRIDSLDARLRTVDPQVREKAREAVERLMAMNPIAMSAAEDMLARQSYSQIGSVQCRDAAS